MEFPIASPIGFIPTKPSEYENEVGTISPLTEGLYSIICREMTYLFRPASLSRKIHRFFLEHGLDVSLNQVEDFLTEMSLQDPIASLASGQASLSRSSPVSETVAWVQDKLRSLGYTIDDANGKYRGQYGQQTQAAVTRFQRVVQLSPDGIAGPQTLRTLKDATALTLPPGLSQKPGAILFALRDPIKNILPSIVKVWRELKAPDPVITSGNDSVHVKGSKHYLNLAIDLRGNNVSDSLLGQISQRLQKELGGNYYVQAEIFPKNPAKDHIHVQYRTKTS